MEFPRLLYYAILLAGCIIGCINYNRNVRPLRFLIILLGYTAISEMTAYWAAVVYRNNWVIQQMYTFVAVLLYTALFYYLVISETSRRLLLYCGVAIVVIGIINFIWFEPINQPASTMFKIRTMFFLAGGFILLFQQLELPSKVQLFKEPAFLVALSLIWFNMVSSLFFFFTPVLDKHGIKSTFIAQLHFDSNLVHYSLFLVAMLYLKNYKNVRVTSN